MNGYQQLRCARGPNYGNPGRDSGPEFFARGSIHDNPGRDSGPDGFN